MSIKIPAFTKNSPVDSARWIENNLLIDGLPFILTPQQQSLLRIFNNRREIFQSKNRQEGITSLLIGYSVYRILHDNATVLYITPNHAIGDHIYKTAAKMAANVYSPKLRGFIITSIPHITSIGHRIDVIIADDWTVDSLYNAHSCKSSLSNNGQFIAINTTKPEIFNGLPLDRLPI